jgi:hypothetical protein
MPSCSPFFTRLSEAGAQRYLTVRQPVTHGDRLHGMKVQSAHFSLRFDLVTPVARKVGGCAFQRRDFSNRPRVRRWPWSIHSRRPQP